MPDYEKWVRVFKEADTAAREQTEFTNIHDMKDLRMFLALAHIVEVAVEDIIDELIESSDTPDVPSKPKVQLEEGKDLVQAMYEYCSQHGLSAEFRLQKTGPDHMPEWSGFLSIVGHPENPHIKLQGSGPTKKAAKTALSRMFLTKMVGFSED